MLQKFLLGPAWHCMQGTKRQRDSRGASRRNVSLTGRAQHWSKAHLSLQLSSPCQLDSSGIAEPNSPFPCAVRVIQLFCQSLGPLVLKVSWWAMEEQVQLGYRVVSEAGFCSPCKLLGHCSRAHFSLFPQLSCGVGCCDWSKTEGQRGEARPG